MNPTGLTARESLPAEQFKSSDDLPVVYRTAFLIENKYYKAGVSLVVLQDDWHQHMPALRSKTEAIIIYWDNTATVLPSDTTLF